MAQLLLSSDTLFQGMNKINDWYSGGSISLSSTTNNSLLNVNSTTTVVAGINWGLGLGRGNSLTSGGAYTTVLNGSGNTASNNFSLIGNGRSNIASASYSTVLNGKKCYVTAVNSTNLNGFFNTISGTYSSVLNGSNNKITGIVGIIGNGLANKVYSNFGAILNGVGNKVDTSATYGTILNGQLNYITTTYGLIGGGNHNLVDGSFGIVLGGSYNNAAHTNSVVLGKGAKSRSAGDFVFGYGTGSANVANNKFRVNTSGQIFAVSTSISTGADYAEMFAYLDNNVNNEDRRGYFVSIKDDKIYIGNDNIIGVVSSNPAIIADAADFEWIDSELKDIWGETIYDTYTKYSKMRTNIFENNSGILFSQPPNKSNKNGILFSASTIDNKETFEISTVKIPKLNPNYNPDIVYIPRRERKEYAAVGLLGKLLVRTSEKITSNKIDADVNGMAKNGSKYHVLKTIKECEPGSYGIVQILFK